MAVDYRPQLSGADRRELLYTGLKNYAIYKSGKDEAAATTFADGQIDRFAAEPKMAIQTGKTCCSAQVIMRIIR